MLNAASPGMFWRFTEYVKQGELHNFCLGKLDIVNLLLIVRFLLGQHGSLVVSIVRKTALGLIPGEGRTLLCGIFMFSLCLRGFPLNTPASSMQVRSTGDSKLPVSVNVSVNGCRICMLALWWTGDLSRVYPALPKCKLWSAPANPKTLQRISGYR